MKNIQMGRVLSRCVFTAAVALSACGGPQSEPPRDASHLQQAEREKVFSLLPQVKEGNSGAREQILKMGGSAVPALISSMDGELKLPALKLAGEIAEMNEGVGLLEKAAPTFIRLLRDDDWQVREASAWTIESVAVQMPGSKVLAKTVPALLANLGDSKLEVRKSAAWALRVVGDESAVPPLIKLLGEPQMKESASEALVAIGIPAITGLVSCLSDTALSRKCARVLGEIGAPVLPEVLNSLTHDDPNVRERSAWILGMVADPSAIPRLREVADGDSEEKVRSAASIAILAIPQ
jgi:HEAT repeat protein